MYTENEQKAPASVICGPGEKAPRSGTYLVQHSSHRLSHFVLAIEGDVFPTCRQCGKEVRFRLHRRANYIENDRDFEGMREALNTLYPQVA